MKTVISTNDAPRAIGPYSQAVGVGDLIFVSGQLPIHPEYGIMPESVEAQTQQSLQNVRAILMEAGVDLEAVVKTTIFIADMNDFGKVNEVYSKFFSEMYPARACVEVSRLPKDALVEIEAIAKKVDRRENKD